MTINRSILTVFAFALLAMTGCDALETADPLECTLVAGPQDVSINSVVDYEVELTGDGDVDSITYRYGNQSQTVSNPTLPWTASREVAAGGEIYLTAEGSVSDGLFEVTMRAIGSEDGAQFQLTLGDDCEQSQ